ncbi:hypothetical protein NDU88_006949 [Pleurodeles waltl]|uniref:Uncharacterized protein n=1 Tax=Pleurodeles waltl TaxID=8319 RepID=A0AAV7M1J5_PLEWA|nr:hypothetical protein NDU88_006949 [Pleurodeles waltl]
MKLVFPLARAALLTSWTPGRGPRFDKGDESRPSAVRFTDGGHFFPPTTSRGCRQRTEQSELNVKSGLTWEDDARQLQRVPRKVRARVARRMDNWRAELLGRITKP